MMLHLFVTNLDFNNFFGAPKLSDHIDSSISRSGWRLSYGHFSLRRNLHLSSQLAFPIVRRVFSRLVANELVSVQPMSGPTGLIFYSDLVDNLDRS